MSILIKKWESLGQLKMGLDPVSLGIMGGAAALGGIGGAIPKTSKETSTSQNTFDPVSGMELELRNASFNDYMKAQDLQRELESNSPQAKALQDLARQQASGIISGQAFQLTPEEEARISQQRQAMLEQSQVDVNRLLDERLGGLSQDLGVRNLRGQAAQELRGRTLAAGAQQYGDAVRQANLIAAQQRMQAPLSRIGAQQNLLSQGLNVNDLLRQQAIQNRASLSNPALLQALQRERLEGGLQVQTGASRGGGGFGGFLGGALGGLGAGVGIASGIGGMSGGSSGFSGPGFMSQYDQFRNTKV